MACFRVTVHGGELTETFDITVNDEKRADERAEGEARRRFPEIFEQGCPVSVQAKKVK
jgi:hypothetical protein